MIRGDLVVVKSVRGSAQVPRNRRSIQKSRQEIDLHDDCEWITASRRPGRTHPIALGRVMHRMLHALALAATKLCFIVLIFLFSFVLRTLGKEMGTSVVSLG